MSIKKLFDNRTVLIGLAVALIFVIVGVSVLSYSMETLDKQAEQLGAQEKPVYNPPFPDYTIPGLGVWGALVVGVAGTLLLFLVGLGVAKLTRKRNQP